MSSHSGAPWYLGGKEEAEAWPLSCPLPAGPKVRQTLECSLASLCRLLVREGGA